LLTGCYSLQLVVFAPAAEPVSRAPSQQWFSGIQLSEVFMGLIHADRLKAEVCIATMEEESARNRSAPSILLMNQIEAQDQQG